MSQDWTEKYRPKSLSGVVGNPKAVGELRTWAESWNSGIPKYRAVVLMGSPGIGKTTSAEALANDMGWGIVEMNASDQRTGSAIKEVAMRGALSETFDDNGDFLSTEKGKRKLIVLDEADNLFGNADRGAVPVIGELIKQTKQPVILIVNDFYDLSRKSSAVKNNTLQITYQRPSSSSIAKALASIAMKENINVSNDVLKSIADNSNGDMRAAVRDLESLALGNKEITLNEASELSNREIRKSTYDLLYSIFRKNSPMDSRSIAIKTDEDIEHVMLWVDENLPYEYVNPYDLIVGYERLSRADVFLGRIHRRQYYRFKQYASDMITAGICDAGESRNMRTFRFPKYLLTMSRSKGMRASKKQVCAKLADYTHNSTKRISSDVLPMLKIMLSNDSELASSVVKDAGLDQEDLAFILGTNVDAPEVKKAFEYTNIEKKTEKPTKLLKSVDTQSDNITILTTEETIEPKPHSKGQKSLFDF